MRKVIINFDHPLTANNTDIFHLYLGGKELHDIALDQEVNIVSELLDRVNGNKNKLIVGRLDADRNDEFIKFLDDSKIHSKVIYGDVGALTLVKRVFRPIFQDYSQPWIFFQEDDLNRLKKYLKEFWSCYGGFWVFIYVDKDFDLEQWKTAKEEMKYDISEFVRTIASSYSTVLLIHDDYAIDVYSKVESFRKVLDEVVALVSKYDLGLSTGHNT